MKRIKFGIFWLGIVLLSNIVSAQSNPGYLGNKQVLEISSNVYIPAVMSSYGPWLKNHTSIAYETSMSKSFSWRGGVRFGSHEFDGYEDLGFFNVSVEENNSYQVTSPSGGTLGYSLTEFFIQPRWYGTDAGALAPFGDFWGLELAYSMIGITDNLTWSSRAVNLPKLQTSVSSLSMAFQWGHRRVIFDNLCWDYHLGVGFNVWNSGNANIAYLDYGTDDSDHEAVIQTMVLMPISFGRIFHGGLGLSYMF